MAQLLFYDTEHKYEVDGVKLPSVSEILRFMSRDIYGDVNQYTLDTAAERGTQIHKATEMLDKLGEAEIDDEYAPYLNAYIQFLREHAVQWTQIERRMYHPGKGYAGTIDRFGLVDGAPTLLDIKSVSSVKKTVVKAQLNGYEDMRRANGMDVAQRLCCLHLKRDGKYTLYDVPFDAAEFEACLTLHKALAAKQPRGAII